MLKNKECEKRTTGNVLKFSEVRMRMPSAAFQDGKDH